MRRERRFEHHFGRSDGMHGGIPFIGELTTEHRFSNAGPLGKVLLGIFPTPLDILLNLTNEGPQVP